MLLVAGKYKATAIGELDHLSVESNTGEALGGEIIKQSGVLALSPSDHWSEYQEPSSLSHRQDPVNDLLRGLTGHRATTRRAVRPTYPGIEQSQVVVDLSDRPNGRSGIA